MAIDDPSLLVNILGRDLRAVTKERDDLQRRVRSSSSDLGMHVSHANFSAYPLARIL